MLRGFYQFFVRRFLRRGSAEQELQEELRSHLAMDIQERVGRGESLRVARESALHSFGNVGLVTEVTRDMWGFGWFEEILQDAGYAFRMFRKSPGFAVIVVLILALGIGANAAIFSLVNAVLLRNLPVTDPKTLVRIGDNNDCCVTLGFRDTGDYSLFSKQTFLDLKANAPEFEELTAMQAGFGFRPIVVRQGDKDTGARSVMGEFVAGNYFRAFGLKAALGRIFSDNDDRPGAPPTAVMSYASWQSRYGGEPAVVGSTLWVNTKAVTVIGIAPPAFFGDRLASSPPEFYLPLNSMPLLTGAPYVDDKGARWLYIMGRVRAGVKLPSLQAKLNIILRRSLEQTITSGDNRKAQLAKAHVVLTPGGAGIRSMPDSYALKLRLLQWTSGLVLLIACANIANLLLVRGMGRKAEMSVRTALGAKRSRIVVQLLTESLILSLLGGLAGMAVAYGGTRMLLAMAFPEAQDLPIAASPSAAVLGFAIGLSLLTGVLFGMTPAWVAARAEPARALRSGARATAEGVSFLQRGLVVLQIALSLVLLIGAGLFGKSLNLLRSADLKVKTANRYIVHINPQAAGYSPANVENFYHVIEERFHSLSGVQKVGIASYTPMEDNSNFWSVQIQGRPPSDSGASFLKVNADYFDSVGTRLVAGRDIAPSDTSASRPVAVVNRAFVHQFFKPGENPIGSQFGLPGPETSASYEIVGVVEDSAYTDVRWKNHAMYFVPLGQRPAHTKVPIEKDDSVFAGAIVLQTARPENSMEALARRTLAGVNPNLAVVKFQSFAQQISSRFTDETLIARLTMFFGGLALLLATVGLYGITSYTVVQRTPEIGIRMALGAERSGVVSVVLRGALTQTAIGLAIGVPTALLCVQFIRSQLYEVSGADPSLLVLSTAILILSAGFAAVIPAGRAASIDPVRALRME